MSHSHRFYHSQVLVVAIFGLAMLFSPVAEAQVFRASTTPSGPIIQVYTVQPSGAVQVTGNGFSPGGKVYIVLHDLWGQQPDEHLWVTASTPVFHVDGTGYGSIQGGTIFVTFSPSEKAGRQNEFMQSVNGNSSGNPVLAMSSDRCDTGTALMSRAYDVQTDVWSNVLDIAPSC